MSIRYYGLCLYNSLDFGHYKLPLALRSDIECRFDARQTPQATRPNVAQETQLFITVGLTHTTHSPKPQEGYFQHTNTLDVTKRAF
eukprot:1367748-Amorphochlora_amoeboformis.AAC.1